MHRKFIGVLSKQDPLFRFLLDEILPQVHKRLRHPNFSVYKMHSSNNDVYLYEDGKSQLRVVGKFFRGSGQKRTRRCGKRAQKEFLNLLLLRSYGLHRAPHHVIKPLGYSSRPEQCSGRGVL